MWVPFKNAKKHEARVRIRINGWLYYHSDDMLTTKGDKATAFKSIKLAAEKARTLYYDRDCAIIENFNGRVKLLTLDEACERFGI